MKTLTLSLLVSSALPLTLAVAPARAVTEVEVTGPTTVTPVNDLTYNTAGIAIGNNLYIYAQSIDYEQCPNNGDAIVAYRFPLNANGDPLDANGKIVTPTRIGRITPCVDPPEGPSSLGSQYRASFGPGQVFKATVNGQTAYQLLVDASNWSNFWEIWRGWTTDGVNWTWETHTPSVTTTSQECFPNPASCSTATRKITRVPVTQPFLKLDSGFTWGYILNPVMLSTAPNTNNASWWGYLKFIVGATGGGIAAVSTGMQVTWSNGTPTISVLTGATPSGPYTVVPNRSLSPTLYDQMNHLIYDRNVKSLLFDVAARGYQLWADAPEPGIFGNYVSCNKSTTATVSCSPSNCQIQLPDGTLVAGCSLIGDRTDSACNSLTPPPGCKCLPQGFTAAPFPYNTYGQSAGSGFRWWTVTQTSISGENGVYSQTRSLPSGYQNARTDPFRWNSASGKRYLFSSTNDRNICSKFLWSSLAGQQIVVTTVANQP
ncbi:MAG: hypothetical protein ACJ76N_11915 [Thermoanaerobaculia bacterium]